MRPPIVTGVSEFSVNYLFVRDLAAAAGLTAFSIVIAPFVYYVHEKGEVTLQSWFADRSLRWSGGARG
jgi:uncharacterized membrane protein